MMDYRGGHGQTRRLNQFVVQHEPRPVGVVQHRLKGFDLNDHEKSRLKATQAVVREARETGDDETLQEASNALYRRLDRLEREHALPEASTESTRDLQEADKLLRNFQEESLTFSYETGSSPEEMTIDEAVEETLRALRFAAEAVAIAEVLVTRNPGRALELIMHATSSKEFVYSALRRFAEEGSRDHASLRAMRAINALQKPRHHGHLSVFGDLVPSIYERITNVQMQIIRLLHTIPSSAEKI